MTALTIDPAVWRSLVARLVAAAHDPADPFGAVSEVLCAYVTPTGPARPRDPQPDHAAALLD